MGSALLMLPSRTGALLLTALVLGAAVATLAPTPARAATVHLDTGHIGPAFIARDATGTANDGYGFDLLLTVAQEAGEHLPLDFARVVVASTSTPQDSNGFLIADQDSNGVPEACVADTGGAGANATITRVVGAPKTTAPLRGFSHTRIVTSGTSYAFEGRQQVPYPMVTSHTTSTVSGSTTVSTFSHPITGGGYGNQSVDLLVTVRVQGCIGPAGSAFPLKFATPTQTVLVQPYVGRNATHLFPGPFTTATFIDPNFTPPTTTSAISAASLVQEPLVASRGQATMVLRLEDADADATALEPTPAGAFPQVQVPAAWGLGKIAWMNITSQAELPHGTRIVLTFQGQGSTQPLDAAPFGLSPATVSTLVSPSRAAMFLQVEVMVPKLGVVDATPLLDITMKVDVPNSYFASTNSNPSLFRFRGFTDDGTAKAAEPTRVQGPTLDVAGSTYSFVFTFTDFSSFVGFAVPTGTGSGPPAPPPPPPATTTSASTTASTTTTTTTSVSTTTTTTAAQTTTTTTSTSSSSSSTSVSATTSSDTPGLGLVALAAAVAGALLVVRRRLP